MAALLDEETTDPGAVDTLRAGEGSRTHRVAVAPATVFGMVAALVGVAIGTGTLNDNSFLTHLATGRLIIDDGFPRNDPYTFTAAGEPWLVQSWLASVTYATLERSLGAGAIVAFHGVLGAVMAACSWALTRPAGALVGRVLLLIPAVVAGSAFWIERPYVIGLVALAATLLAAEGRLHPGWLVPLGWAWVNSHGGWPLGVAAVVLLALGTRLDGGDWRPETKTVGFLCGGLLLGAANPYGPRILLFPFELLGRREQLSLIREWQAPRFDSAEQLAVLALGAVAVLALARRASWRAALPLAAFTVLACTGARNLPVAALVLLPGAANGLAGWGSSTGSSRHRPLALAAAVLGVIGVGVLATAARRPPFRFDQYPVAAIGVIEERGLAPTGGPRVLAPDFVGNFFSLRYGADAAVYVDDRIEVTPGRITAEYEALLAGGPGWDEVLGTWDFDAVVWPVDEPLAELLRLDDRWQIEYEDDEWLVALPST